MLSIVFGAAYLLSSEEIMDLTESTDSVMTSSKKQASETLVILKSYRTSFVEAQVEIRNIGYSSAFIHEILASDDSIVTYSMELLDGTATEFIPSKNTVIVNLFTDQDDLILVMDSQLKYRISIS